MKDATIQERLEGPWPEVPRAMVLRIVLFLFLVFGALASPSATVRIRLLDADSGQTTPALACIINEKGEVRLPPDGRKMLRPSMVDEFYRGVEFDPDPNWIGPVRKMQGKGDNKDRSFVYGLLPSIPYWAEPVLYQVSGEFAIELPPGQWHLAVEHGMEYVPNVRKFEVSGPNPVSIEMDLKRWVDLPGRGWWSGDVHVHHPTLKKAHREFLLQYARAADLHLVNVLEMGHHRGTDFKQESFGPAARVRQGNFILVSGQEEPRSSFGHIIGLNTTKLARDLPTYDFYDLAFKRIHQQNGALVGFAHFAWNGCDLPRGFPCYVTTGELDFIELLQFGLLNDMDYYDYLNLGFRLTAAAGSDTPWGSTIGEVRTFVHTGPEFSADAWFANLKQGHSFVSNGPVLEFTVDGQLPGEELRRKRGETVRVRAKVTGHPSIGLPKTLSLVGNDGIIKMVENPDGKDALFFEWDQEIAQSQWMALGAVCYNHALAHTTPVYVVVDGKPTWSAGRGPDIIARQLESISRIEGEVKGKTGFREQGIQERLDRARTFYQELLEQMK